MTEKRKRRTHPVDDVVAKRVREFREARHLEQKDVAGAMRERGFQWSQTTVWSVEKDGRPLRIAEALALSEILDPGGSRPLEELVIDEDTAILRQHLSQYEAWREDSVNSLRNLGTAWRQMQDSLDRMEGSGAETLDYTRQLMDRAVRLRDGHSPAHILVQAIESEGKHDADGLLFALAVSAFQQFIEDHG